MTEYFSLLPDIVKLADDASEAIMAIYRSGFETKIKNDQSPVTEADIVAEKIILEGLSQLTPNLPVVAEEQVADGEIPILSSPYYWLVDPLDGTKEFVRRNDEFTVNIALVRTNFPILGVVCAPALKSSYWGAAGHGSFCRENGNIVPIAVNVPTDDGVSIISSRHHGNNRELQDFLATFNVVQTLEAGSSLKFCMVAKGDADLYPRFGPTCEWDTAAGHAILDAAGGQVTNVDGSPFLYRKKHFRNSNFIAWGGLNPS